MSLYGLRSELPWSMSSATILAFSITWKKQVPVLNWRRPPVDTEKALICDFSGRGAHVPYVNQHRQCLQKVPLSKIQILHNLSADDITISDVYASVKKYQSLRLRRNRMLSGMHTIYRILFDKRFMHSYSTPIHTINLTFAVHKLMKNFPILYAAQQQ